MADSGGLHGGPAAGPVELGAVPETLLWTLYHRASEARRPDSVLHDPMAVDLVERIDFPFEQRFGKPRAGLAQWQALRARCFDLEIARFLARSPSGTVVALGEGLETQFWRVDNGTVRWLGVDLPETVELRRRLLPSPDRHRLIACSVLDDRWLDELDRAADVLVTAQGLLMYLEPEQVRTLLDDLRAEAAARRDRVRRRVARPQPAKPARQGRRRLGVSTAALDVGARRGGTPPAGAPARHRGAAAAAAAARPRRPLRGGAAAARDAAAPARLAARRPDRPVLKRRRPRAAARRASA